MKLRTGDPWMPAPAYSRSLGGLTVNLLVRDIDRAVAFQQEVLGAQVVYRDPDFAVMSGFGGEWMLHADHTYLNHPLHGWIGSQARRGAGVELRLHGRDPDEAERAAARLGCTVLSPAADKPHGMRETHLVDDDGYVWVTDVPLASPP
jgi:catechol 2,3-dioxygenase-like lactoylglutathione lyase family enzyme